MAQVRCRAGLAVHAAKVVAATMDREDGELVMRRLAERTSEAVEVLRRVACRLGCVSCQAIWR